MAENEDRTGLWSWETKRHNFKMWIPRPPKKEDKPNTPPVKTNRRRKDV
jgi:hypothetical protein